jgi:hypothetical protein
MTPSRYTVQRCRKDGTAFGPVHIKSRGMITRCGWVIKPPYWLVLDKATCKKCRKEKP